MGHLGGDRSVGRLVLVLLNVELAPSGWQLLVLLGTMLSASLDVNGGYLNLVRPPVLGPSNGDLSDAAWCTATMEWAHEWRSLEGRGPEGRSQVTTTNAHAQVVVGHTTTITAEWRIIAQQCSCFSADTRQYQQTRTK